MPPMPVAEIFFSLCFFGPSSFYHLVFKTYFIVEILLAVAFIFMFFCFFLYWYHKGPPATCFFFSIAHIIVFRPCHVCFSFLVCLVWLQDALRDAGAFPWLVEALNAHQGHAGVAYRACFALGYLAYGNAANQVT